MKRECVNSSHNNITFTMYEKFGNRDIMRYYHHSVYVRDLRLQEKNCMFYSPKKKIKEIESLPTVQ